MQREKRKLIFIVWASLALFWVFVACFSRSKGELFDIIKKIPFVGGVIAYNLTPADYYNPVLRFPLKADAVEADFVCKYDGRYDLHISNIEIPMPETCAISMEATFAVKGRDGILLKKCKAKPSLFAYSSSSAVGDFRYWYGAISVPENIPVRSVLSARIRFAGDIGDLLKCNPNAHFEIVKCFDK